MEFPLIYDKNSVGIYEVNRQVYYRTGDLDHRRQCNGGFILLKSCTAVVDVPSEEGAEEMLRESQELFGLPVKYAFLTHAHPDHDLGLPVFADRGGIELYAAYNAFEELERRGVAFPKKCTGVRGRLAVTLEGTRIVLEKLSVTAHSPWDVLVGLPDHDLMFTGDLVVNEPILYLESCNLSNWIRQLSLLRKRNVGVLARGHGGCIGSEYIDREAEYLEALCSVGRYVVDGRTVRELENTEDDMGKLLLELCERDYPGARLLEERSGAAAYYQLTQFLRYNVDPGNK